MQGLSHKGYVSKPPLPKVCAANLLCGQEEKKRKDEVNALRKRLRREAHEKENKRRQREGLSP